MEKTPPKNRLLFLLLLLSCGLNAQNLVPNPSFEDFVLCPCYPCLYESFVLDWYRGTIATSDYFNACSDPPPNPISAGVPANSLGYQEALTGVAYSGIRAHDPNGSGREYIQVLLTEPLEAGSCYNLEMYTSSADNPAVCYGINRVGMYLSATPPPVQPNNEIYVTPQLYYEDVQLDTENWVQLTGTYTATGGEQYLTIGLFDPIGEYDVQLIDPNNDIYELAYYYIEDVRVELETEPAPQDIEVNICEGECYELDNIQYCDPGVYVIPSTTPCFAPGTLTINLLDNAVSEILTPEMLNCNNSTVTLDPTGSSSGINVTYQWTGPNSYSSTQQFPTVFEPGIYTLVVQSDLLCPVEATVEVFQDLSEPDIDAIVNGAIDCSNSSVILEGISSNPSVSFHWFGPGVDVNVPFAVANDPGFYTLTVTGSNGCTNTIEVEVIEDMELPDISADVSGQLNCDNTVVTLIGNSMTSNVTYAWFGPGVDTNVPIITTDQPGDYTFAVIGSNGCVATSIVTVVEEDTGLDIDVFVSDTLDCINTIVTLTGSSTTPGVSFQWSGPGLLVDSSIALVDTAGDYTLTIVSEDGGCSIDTIITVEQNFDTPEIIIQSPDELTCVITSIDLNAGNSSGFGPLGFEWQDETGNVLGGDSILTVDSSGNYLLVLTNIENGCADSTIVEVGEDTELPEADIESSGLLTCDSTEINLDGSNSVGDSLSFQWLDENNEFLDSINIIEVSQAGVYTLIVINENNACADSSQIQVLEDLESPFADAGPNGNLTCTDSEVTLDGSNSMGSNLTYEWLDENNVVISDQMTTQVTQPGEYTLIVTSGTNGCTASSTVMVTPDANLPTALIDLPATLTCAMTEVTLDGSNSTSVSGNISYEWQNESGDIISINEQATVSTGGIYTLIVTDPDNGCSESTQIEVQEDLESPFADAGPNGNLTCTDSEVTLDGSNSMGSNLTYEWLDENNVVISDQMTTQVTQPGEYTLIVTSGTNGCTASSTVTVAPDANLPIAIIDLPSTLTCTTTEVILNGSNSTSVSGNISYEWQNESGDIISVNEQATVSTGGIYTLIVTGPDNGCSESTQVEVLEDVESPFADAGPNGNLTCTDSEVTLDGSNSMGSNLTYEWLDENNVVISDQMTTQVTQPGEYTLIVTSGANGCTTSSTVMVAPDADLPTALIDLPSTLTCTTTEVTLDGSSSTSVSGNISYEWQNESEDIISVNEQATVSTGGIYTLIVTDPDNGCSESTQVEVLEDVESPFADAGPNGNLTCTDSEVTLDGSNSMGSNLTYEWLDENNVVISDQLTTQVTQPGEYILIVTSGTNGCTASSTVMVTPDSNLPTALIDLPSTLTCATTEVLLDGSNSTSASGAISFEWIDGVGNIISINEQVDVSTSGIYTLIVTDPINGCSQSTQVEVLEDVESPFADAGPNGNLTCTDSEVTLDGSNSMGSNLTYEWLDENNVVISDQLTTQVTQPGEYTLIVTIGTNGCTASSTVMVTPDLNLPTALIDLPSTLTCTTTEVILNGSNSTSVSGNISYEWQNESGDIISINEQATVSTGGIYTLIVTDPDNGCSESTQVEVLEDVESPVVMIDNTGPLNIDCNASSLVLDASGSSPFGDISFEWTTNDGNILSDGDTPGPEINQAGVYYLTVTNLINFCTATDSIVIGENFDVPVALIENPQMLTCLITEITIDATGSSTNGDLTYSWTSNPAGGIVSGVNTLEPLINTPGTYTLMILNNENGCSIESLIVVGQDINPPTAIANVVDQFDCLTENVTLDGTGSSEGTSIVYQWTGIGIVDNAFSLYPTVYQVGDYQLLVTNQENGCTASTQINVSENTNEPIGFTYDMLAPDCFGNPGSIEVLSIDGGEPPYLYSIDGGGNFSQLSTFSSLEPGNYSVLVQDANGCEYEDVITVPAIPEIDVSLESEVFLNLGDDYELNAVINFPQTEIDTIIWSPSEGLSCVDCLNPEILAIVEGGQYTVTIINQDGCQTTDEIILRVRKTRTIFIPNVFSPHNEDGFNDIFMIYGDNDKIKEIKTFQIYDRWGEVVFEANNFQANDPSNGWDGFFKNERLNSGVFVYFAEVEFIDGVKKIYAGDVTIAN